MVTEPLTGWRNVNVRATKTALNLAQEIKELLDFNYPNAEKAVVVYNKITFHTSLLYTKHFRMPRHVDSLRA